MEHICGGIITGALYKVNLGVRGIVVGSVVGKTNQLIIIIKIVMDFFNSALP